MQLLAEQVDLNEFSPVCVKTEVEETSSFGTVIGRLCGSNLQEIIMSIFIFC